MSYSVKGAFVSILVFISLWSQAVAYNILDHLSEFDIELQRCDYYNDDYTKFKLALNNNGDPVHDISKSKTCLFFKPKRLAKTGELYGIVLGSIAAFGIVSAILRTFPVQYNNVVKLMEFIQKDSTDKGQSTSMMVLRIVSSFRFLSCFTLALVYVPIAGTFFVLRYILSWMFPAEEFLPQSDVETREPIRFLGHSGPYKRIKKGDDNHRFYEDPEDEPRALLSQSGNKDKRVKVTRSEIDKHQYNETSLISHTQGYLMPHQKFYTIVKYGSLLQDDDDDALDEGDMAFDEWNEEENCTICHDRFQESDVIIKLPCKHFFHNGCLYSDRLADVNKPGDRSMMKCPKCQLNLVKYEQYHRELGLNPSNVEFQNNK